MIWTYLCLEMRDNVVLYLFSDLISQLLRENLPCDRCIFSLHCLKDDFIPVSQMINNYHSDYVSKLVIVAEKQEYLT